jgi:Kef-type K+ transport system membrane component KefB
MFRARQWLLYLLILGVGAVFIVAFLERGILLDAGHATQVTSDATYWQQFKTTYQGNLTHPLAKLLLQILTIIITARIFGFVCTKLGLPSVIGEIVAGIFLGPSFLADYFPAYSAFLFPAASLGNLQFLSQIGLILFMFVVGMELDLNVLRNKAHDALIVSHASIVFPFTMGVGLSYYMFERFGPKSIGFMPFALFMGIAMSITAFPVLARIVQERGLSRTRIGGVAITCAAFDDITAWCMLAVVIAIVKAGTIVSSMWTIALAVGYVTLMFVLVRPFLRKLGDIYTDRESLSKPVVAVFFLLMLVSSYATEVIGIHALFGAFLAGVIMPVNVRFRNIFIDKVEDVALVLLLPLFFVLTGLRTQIGLLNDPGLWKWCGVILAVGVAGKFLGSALPAKLMGNSWRESLMLGALMNTRGLVELVVLNIGYDLGVLSPEIFAMLVIMALVTTFMTGPLLGLIDKVLPEKVAEAKEKLATETRKFKVLVPFGDPERGRSMVRVANAFVKSNENADITALHFTLSSELNPFNTAVRERESFNAIRKVATTEAMRLDTLFKASNDTDKDVVAAINSGIYDMAIVGAGRSIYQGTVLGRMVGIGRRIIDPERLFDTLTGKESLFERTEFEDRVRLILRESRIPVGIYVEKNFEKLDHVVVPFFGLGDSFLLTYAQKLVYNQGAQVTLLDVGDVFGQSPEMLATVRALEQASPDKLKLQVTPDPARTFPEGQDLMLISIESWKRAVEKQSTWLAAAPSSLIMRP